MPGFVIRPARPPGVPPSAGRSDCVISVCGEFSRACGSAGCSMLYSLPGSPAPDCAASSGLLDGLLNSLHDLLRYLLQTLSETGQRLVPALPDLLAHHLAAARAPGSFRRNPPRGPRPPLRWPSLRLRPLAFRPRADRPGRTAGRPSSRDRKSCCPIRRSACIVPVARPQHTGQRGVHRGGDGPVGQLAHRRRLGRRGMPVNCEIALAT